MHLNKHSDTVTFTEHELDLMYFIVIIKSLHYGFKEITEIAEIKTQKLTFIAFSDILILISVYFSFCLYLPLIVYYILLFWSSVIISVIYL